MANLDSYEVSAPIRGICKQSAIWGQSGNTTQPLVYLQRPKWIKCDILWQRIVDGIRLDLPAGFKI